MVFGAVDKKYLQDLYKARGDAETMHEIENVFGLSEGIGPLQYYCSILFHSVPCAKRFPAYFAPLLSSYAYTSFLLRQHIGIGLSEAEFMLARGHLLRGRSLSCGGNRYLLVEDRPSALGRAPLGKEPRAAGRGFGSANEADGEGPEQPSAKRARLDDGADNRRLLSFLFRIESEFHETSELDPAFVKALFAALPAETKTKILASPRVTPLKICLSGPHVRRNGFYSFCALESIDPAEAFRKAQSLPYRAIRRTILRSKFSSIRARLSFFYRLFPELKTYDQVVSANRLEYISTPERIPLEGRTLRTYIQVISEGHAAASDNIQKTALPLDASGCLDNREHPGNQRQGARRSLVGLKLHFIGKILALNSARLLSSVVNCWFMDSPRLVSDFLQRRPQIVSLDVFVRCVPGILDHFSLIMQFVKSTRDAYYDELLLAIMVRYPRRENAALVKDNLLYFNLEFISKIKRQLDDVGSKSR